MVQTMFFTTKCHTGRISYCLGDRDMDTAYGALDHRFGIILCKLTGTLSHFRVG